MHKSYVRQERSVAARMVNSVGAMAAERQAFHKLIRRYRAVGVNQFFKCIHTTLDDVSLHRRVSNESRRGLIYFLEEREELVLNRPVRC